MYGEKKQALGYSWLRWTASRRSTCPKAHEAPCYGGGHLPKIDRSKSPGMHPLRRLERHRASGSLRRAFGGRTVGRRRGHHRQQSVDRDRPLRHPPPERLHLMKKAEKEISKCSFFSGFRKKRNQYNSWQPAVTDDNSRQLLLFFISVWNISFIWEGISAKVEENVR